MWCPSFTPSSIIAIALSKTPSRADVVVRLAHAVEVDVDHEALVRRDRAVHVLVQQQAVRAEVDVALALDDLLDELRELGIDRGLAAADRDDGSTRALDGVDALTNREPVLELPRVALDRATDAGEVAGVERLEHQDERVALVAPDRVANRVLDRVRHDVDRESHQFTP